MVGDVQLPGQGDWSSVLPSHHVEPLQLDAEHQGRPLYLVLLGGGNLLVALLTLVHVLARSQVLSAEISRKCCVYVVSLPEVNNS